MRKALYPLLYISLLGFIATTVLNLLRKTEIAMFVMVFSLCSLLSGCLIAIFYRRER
jgi:hypothetical protein